MKRSKSPALFSEVSWLGDRYLLAQLVPVPAARRADAYQPYFTQAPSWHEPRRPVGPRRGRH